MTITTGNEPKGLSGGTRMAKTTFTPSGGVKASSRHASEKRGHTMKGGGFPIEDKADLARAKHDIGRAKNPAAARAWVNKRAKQLGGAPVGAHAHHPPAHR
jgi:hypothetical protein